MRAEEPGVDLLLFDEPVNCVLYSSLAGFLTLCIDVGFRCESPESNIPNLREDITTRFWEPENSHIYYAPTFNC